MQGKFTKTSDIGVFATLTSTLTLFNISTGKVLKEFKGHVNNDFICEFIFTKTQAPLKLGAPQSAGSFKPLLAPEPNLTGLITTSEDGKLYRYDWKNSEPVDSIQISDSPLDLIVETQGGAVTSGRGTNIAAYVGWD